MKHNNTIIGNVSHKIRVLLDMIFYRTIGKIVSDKTYLRVRFKLRMGYSLNLNNPKTFSEKLQWIKLYNHLPEYTNMVDKYSVKEYVASVLGRDYIIPTIGVWDKPEDIDWDSLPDRFVLKCTHDSVSVTIVKNKNTINRDEIVEKYKRLIKRDYYRKVREWPYKNVPHRIIAEEYIESDPINNDLPDYKFFCFDGEVRAMFVATERQNPNEEVKFDFFDTDYNHLPFRQGHENAKTLPQKPKHFDLMKQIASKLSKGIPHVRVDLYEVGDRVLFGELTFFHFSGMVPFNPSEWDAKFGDWITLPQKKTV